MDDFLTPELVSVLRDDVQQRLQDFTRAGVGRGQAHRMAQDMRTDKTAWLDGQTPAQARFLALLEDMRQHINQRLLLGLFHVEAQYAIYEPGGYYRRHVDRFEGTSNRKVSMVVYLNTSWTEADGGHLHLYQSVANAAGQDTEMTHSLTPQAGRAVVFMSEDIPHAVQASQRTRYSVAAWFHVRA